jgi:hypothetical protein
MVDGIICASICKPYGPIVREHRHIQAEDRFQTTSFSKRVEFDLEPLMFNEALLLTISPEFAWNIHGIQH